jgi:hypothetical protein
MATAADSELTTASTATTESGHEFDAEVAVPAAEKLDRDEVRKLVGAKNVMGTCSG